MLLLLVGLLSEERSRVGSLAFLFFRAIPSVVRVGLSRRWTRRYL